MEQPSPGLRASTDGQGDPPNAGDIRCGTGDDVTVIRHAIPPTLREEIEAGTTENGMIQIGASPAAHQDLPVHDSLLPVESKTRNAVGRETILDRDQVSTGAVHAVDAGQCQGIGVMQPRPMATGEVDGGNTEGIVRHKQCARVGAEYRTRPTPKATWGS